MDDKNKFIYLHQLNDLYEKDRFKHTTNCPTANDRC